VSVLWQAMDGSTGGQLAATVLMAYGGRGLRVFGCDCCLGCCNSRDVVYATSK